MRQQENIVLIVYYKFYDYIKRKNIKIKDIIKNTGISGATIANSGANKGVATDTIDKICNYLNRQPGDIMEFETDERKNERI